LSLIHLVLDRDYDVNAAKNKVCDSVGVCVGAYFIYIIYMIPRYTLWSQEKYK